MQTYMRPSVATGAHTLDGRWYTSADVFALEQERIFARSWICVGREEQLEQAGDYFLTEIAGESLIIVRDGSDAVRALYNVCRHRGTRVCSEPTGHFIGSIQCPYHAWTYALDGALLAARNMQQIEGFDRSDYPLGHASVGLAGGFIFVSLADPVPPNPFDLLADKAERWDLAGLREASRFTYDLHCNWKLIVQNYSECYHCPVIHPQLDKLQPSDSGRNDFESGPVLGGYSVLREQGGGLSTTGRTTRPPVGSVDGEDLDRTYYYTIFPTMLLSLHPDYAMVHTLEPRAADRTEIAFTLLFDPTMMARPDFDPSDVAEFWDVTNRQDWRVNELTQLGLGSRGYRPGPFSNAEGLLYAFDRYYTSVME